jgi:hypothetical protein
MSAFLPITVLTAAPSSSSVPLRDCTYQQQGSTSGGGSTSSRPSTVNKNDSNKSCTKTIDDAYKSQEKAKALQLSSESKAANTTTAATPYEEYVSKFKTFLDENAFAGYVLVQGITPCCSRDDRVNGGFKSRNIADVGDHEEKDTSSKFSKTQMETLRYICLTQTRAKQFAEMRDLLVGDEPRIRIGESRWMMVVNSSFSYHVLETYDFVYRKLHEDRSSNDKLVTTTRSTNKKNKMMMMIPAERLDFLLAYTAALNEYDAWMTNNEGGMGTVVKGLASIWKRLLTKHSDEELGWDVEYSKPGVMALLRQFKDKIASVPNHNELGKFSLLLLCLV